MAEIGRTSGALLDAFLLRGVRSDETRPLELGCGSSPIGELALLLCGVRSDETRPLELGCGSSLIGELALLLRGVRPLFDWRDLCGSFAAADFGLAPGCALP